VGKRRLSRGQSLVEFAIIAPVFLLLCMGALDLGRVYFAHIALVGAVEQGVRVAGMNPTSSDTDVRNAVVNEPNGTLSAYTVNASVSPPHPATVPPTNRPKGSTVTVTANTTFSLITPLMQAIAGGQSVVLNATASMVVQ